MLRARRQFASLLAILVACLALCASFVKGYTFKTYNDKECKGDPLNVTTVKQGKCEVLSELNPERPRSGKYVCEFGILTTSVWIGSIDCGETKSKGGVYLLEEKQDVADISLSGTLIHCTPSPWLEDGNRWVKIDCAAGSKIVGSHSSFLALLLVTLTLLIASK